MDNSTYIAKASKLKQELDALRPLSREDEQRVMQKFRLDWNYHSNNLEGNSLNYGENRALLLFGITAQGKPLKDHFEVQGHNQAIELVLDVVKSSRPLTRNFIREIHKLILKEPYEIDAISSTGKPVKKWIEVGSYKRTPNHVLTSTNEIFRFATPEETPVLMHDLITWYRLHLDREDLHPILLASNFHYKFIRIHPFDDGNGRTARILMNLILMKFDYPPAIIRTDDKQKYFAALRQADSEIIEPFIEFISKNVMDSMQLMINAAEGLSVEDPDDIDKEIAILDQKIKGYGGSPKEIKSKANILVLYDKSVTDLIERFLKKCMLLAKHYLNTTFQLSVNSRSSNDTLEDQINQCRLKIDDKTRIISMKCTYSAFKMPGLEWFGLSTQINLNFYELSYTAHGMSDTKAIDKLYGDQLTDDEIMDLVGIEIRRHNKLLEEEMSKIGKNSK